MPHIRTYNKIKSDKYEMMPTLIYRKIYVKFMQMIRNIKIPNDCVYEIIHIQAELRHIVLTFAFLSRKIYIVPFS